MHEEDSLVTALVCALEHDSSPQALRRAVAALRTARGVSNSRAYAILVRAKAGLPVEPIKPRASQPAQSAPAPSSGMSRPRLLAG